MHPLRLSILYVRFGIDLHGQKYKIISFNSLCEIHVVCCPAIDFSYTESSFNSLCEIRLYSGAAMFLPLNTFNSLCEIPTPFLAPVIGLRGDLSLSASRCAATPQLAPEYIKGSGYTSHQPLDCLWAPLACRSVITTEVLCSD